MRNVAVIGVGLHAYGKWTDKKPKDLARTAVDAALKSSGIAWTDLQSAWCGHTSLGMTAGARLFAQFGQTGLSITNVENASATGSYAFRGAYLEVASGEFDIALALGIDMMPRREPSASAPKESAPKESAPKENKPKPPTGPMLKFASDARAHMEKYGTTIDQLAQVSVKQHYNAARNPYAQYQEEVTLAQVHAAREVAAPLTVLHCCPFGDGAAAGGARQRRRRAPARDPEAGVGRDVGLAQHRGQRTRVDRTDGGDRAHCLSALRHRTERARHGRAARCGHDRRDPVRREPRPVRRRAGRQAGRTRRDRAHRPHTDQQQRWPARHGPPVWSDRPRPNRRDPGNCAAKPARAKSPRSPRPASRTWSASAVRASSRSSSVRARSNRTRRRSPWRALVIRAVFMDRVPHVLALALALLLLAIASRAAAQSDAADELPLTVHVTQMVNLPGEAPRLTLKAEDRVDAVQLVLQERGRAVLQRSVGSLKPGGERRSRGAPNRACTNTRCRSRARRQRARPRSRWTWWWT